MWEGTWKPLVQMKTGSQIAEVFQKMFLKSQQVTLQIGAGWCVDILWISTFPSIFSILFGFPMQPKMSPTLVLVAVSASLDLCLHLSRRSRGHFLSPPFSPYLFSRCRFASCPNGWFLSCWFTHSYLPLHVFLTHDWQLCTAMFYVGACCLGSALVYFFFWTYYFLSTCAYYISKLQGSFFSSGAEGARTRWCTGIGWGQHPALATWTWSIDLTRRRAGALPAYTRRVGTVFSWSFPGCCVFPRILKAVATWIESTHTKQAEVHMQKRTYSTSMFAKCIWYFGNTGHVG